ncbi:glucan synthase, partial [Haematococcus lacustris]
MTGGGVRLHYGHPDVFNRQQVMTRGGLSKATRTLHVSEDVFSGMGHLLRGGKNAFVEHSSVGK